MNKHPHKYQAFGLIIASEMEIPEFLPAEDTRDADVMIGLQHVPGQLEHPKFSGVRFQGSPGKFLLKVDKVARYLVEDGRSIGIEAEKDAEEADIRLFLLGSAFGALIHQRGLLPIHGSAIVFNNEAVIFSGLSGAGKSTLAASFAKKGYAVITDDVCVITPGPQGQPVIHPGYPQMKLWADSVTKLGVKEHAKTTVRKGIEKFGLPVHPQFASTAIPLKGVYIIGVKNSDGFSVAELKGLEKFNILKNNTYRLNFIKGTGTTASHFQHIGLIAAACFVKKIERPAKGFQLEALTDLIEKDLQ